MELEEVLLKRRSIRKFSSEKVADEDIEKILHAAMSGPSAMNKKPWEFYVIKDEEVLKKLKKVCLYSGYDAPLAIVVAGNMHHTIPLNLSEYWIQDCSAATENILLEATNLNLGSVWCGVYPQKEACKRLQEALGIKDFIVPLNIIYIGHRATDAEPRDQFDKDCVHII